MARATMPKGPKPRPTKWTLVFTTKLRRFNTLQDAEAAESREGARARGSGVYPAAALRMGGQTLRSLAKSPQRLVRYEVPGSAEGRMISPTPR